MQIESLGGVHDRIAEVRDFGENRGCNGAEGRSVVHKIHCIPYLINKFNAWMAFISFTIDFTTRMEGYSSNGDNERRSAESVPLVA